MLFEGFASLAGHLCGPCRWLHWQVTLQMTGYRNGGLYIRLDRQLNSASLPFCLGLLNCSFAFLASIERYMRLVCGPDN